MARISLLISFLLLVSCSHEPRHALIDRILVPVDGKSPLLCNRAFEPEKDSFEFQCMDLRDVEQRQLLWKLKFVCKIGKQMWAIGHDFQGLIRNHNVVKKGGLFERDKNIRTPEFLDIEKDYPFMVGSAMKCFSEDRYSWDLM